LGDTVIDSARGAFGFWSRVVGVNVVDVVVGRAMGGARDVPVVPNFVVTVVGVGFRVVIDVRPGAVVTVRVVLVGVASVVDVDVDDAPGSELGSGGRSCPGRFSVRTATDWWSSRGQTNTSVLAPATTSTRMAFARRDSGKGRTKTIMGAGPLRPDRRGCL
jgi:hypothetical protein